MKQVTRNIDPSSAQNLLDRGARACFCFASEQEPQAVPLVLVWQDGRYLAGISGEVDRRPGFDQDVVLLIDEGIHFFDLRAVYIRGVVKPAEAARDARVGHTWFEVVPLKTVAWDYGTLREVSDER